MKCLWASWLGTMPEKRLDWGPMVEIMVVVTSTARLSFFIGRGLLATAEQNGSGSETEQFHPFAPGYVCLIHAVKVANGC